MTIGDLMSGNYLHTAKIVGDGAITHLYLDGKEIHGSMFTLTQYAGELPVLRVECPLRFLEVENITCQLEKE